MASKPSDGHVEWITDDDTDKYIAPSDAKRLQGWIKEEKPPFQYFNWFFRLVDRWLQWAEAQSDENVAAIAANAQAISDEATARSDADTTLQNNINAEASARAGADSTLQSNIDSETSIRASADSTLQSNIDAEASARASADSAHAVLTDTHGATSANTASRIVMRDGSGDVIGRLFRTEYASATAGLAYFLGQVALGAGADNYARPMTIAQAKAVLGVVEAPVFVSNANGNPNLSDTPFDIASSLANVTWESIGPTGSGANNIWTALDSLPSDITWIKIRVKNYVRDVNTSSLIKCLIYARKNGSSQAVSEANQISEASFQNDLAAGEYSQDTNIVEATIPVNNRTFDLYIDNGVFPEMQTAVAYLVGYGY